MHTGSPELYPELTAYGWNPQLTESWPEMLKQFPVEKQLFPARVIGSATIPYKLYTPYGIQHARITGRLLQSHLIPVTGDWLVCEKIDGDDSLLIHAILPRLTHLARKSSGSSNRPQILAANVDTTMILMGLDENYSLRRLERFLVTAHEGHTRAIVVLSKKDLLDAGPLLDHLNRVQAICNGVPVVCIDNLSGDGIQDIRALLQPGKTYAMIGSSGTGKSSLINQLIGENRQATNAVRKGDHKGRHTTTARELIAINGLGILIDAPGLKEIQPILAADSIDTVFSEIATLASCCSFRNCSHRNEPGCAVLAAISSGELDAERWHAYEKMLREDERLNAKLDGNAMHNRKQKLKQTHQMYRQIQNDKRRRKGR